MQRSTAELRIQIVIILSQLTKEGYFARIDRMTFSQKIWFFLVDTFQTLVIAASIFLIIYVFLFRPFQVNGESMIPSFENKEYVLTNLISLRFQAPKRGDVIVFKSPTNSDKDFIKRVIGEPGDKVSIKDGNVYVNGDLLDESSYLDQSVDTQPGQFLKETQEISVTPDHFFVMGDNRMHSSDSREWGMVKSSEIIGKSWVVYWPPNHSRIIQNPY